MANNDSLTPRDTAHDPGNTINESKSHKRKSTNNDEKQEQCMPEQKRRLLISCDNYNNEVMLPIVQFKIKGPPDDDMEVNIRLDTPKRRLLLCLLIQSPWTQKVSLNLELQEQLRYDLHLLKNQSSSLLIESEPLLANFKAIAINLFELTTNDQYTFSYSNEDKLAMYMFVRKIMCCYDPLGNRRKVLPKEMKQATNPIILDVFKECTMLLDPFHYHILNERTNNVVGTVEIEIEWNRMTQ